MPALSHSARWSLAALVAVIALVVALWPRDRAEPDASSATEPSSPAATQSGPDPTDPALAACPVPAAAGSGPLAGVTLTCLRDGSVVDLGSALAGTPALLNLWAYWCAPCAHELPLLAEFAARADGAVTVMTVHSDAGVGKALARLRDLDIVLPGVADAEAKVRAAVGAPGVLPVSVLIRPDGSVAKVVVKPFESVAEIEAAVAENLGVTL